MRTRRYRRFVSHPQDDPAQWYFGGRYYLVTGFSDVAIRDGYGWELDDVAPAPGRGTVLEAFQDDTTGLFTCWARGGDVVLPFELVEHFVVEARKGVPPGKDVPVTDSG